MQLQQPNKEEEAKRQLLSKILIVNQDTRISWQYEVFPDDTNFNQRQDKKNNFVDHDELQSQAIEYEYQAAIKQNTQTHSFLLSGNFQKNRNNQEYAVVFEDLNDKFSWYKTNTKNFRVRRLRRQQIKISKQQQNQFIKTEKQTVKRWPEKQIVWQYKVFTEDQNFSQNEDQFMHYVNHDPKQSIQIENEYQKALVDQKKEHSFILSGDWEKNRCKWEYEIRFEDLINTDKWFKMNTITKKKRPISRIEIWIEIEEVLQQKQKSCLEDIFKTSKKESDECRPALLQRTQKLGLNLEQIEKYLKKQAQLIVHVHLDKYLKYYVQDTKYRNQFETGFSSGSKDLIKRKGWESRMFGTYYDNALGSERPKYGVINFTNDPKGDLVCRTYGYGNDFLELNPNIRSRCTITNKDSSYDDAILGTLEDFCHVLMGFTDDELYACQLAAEGKSEILKQKEMIKYKEIQIHGPIDFEKDVICVHASNQHTNNPELQELLEQFKKKFNIGVKYIDGKPDEKQQELISKIEADLDYGNK